MDSPLHNTIKTQRITLLHPYLRHRSNHINSNLYHYGGNNPIKYTDPTGEAIAVIPFIAPTVIAGAKAIGAWLASLFVVGAAATAVGVTLDAAIDDGKSESPSDSSTVPSPLIDSGVSSAGAMPPSPDDDRNKSDRNKPKQTGPENGIEIEHNVDGSVKRVTQFDENGNFLKEVRPNFKGQHGIEGPTTKVPQYNTDASGKVHMNGYKVRPATPEEIMLLK